VPDLFRSRDQPGETAALLRPADRRAAELEQAGQVAPAAEGGLADPVGCDCCPWSPPARAASACICDLNEAFDCPSRTITIT